MKNMKIKLTEQSNFAVVAQALADAGYHNVVLDSAYKDATELYAYENGIVLKTTARTNTGGYFETHKNEEHFLDPWLGEFVTADYWTQPKTPEQKPITPIGIRPRAAVRQDRMAEIVLAMGRYVEAGVRIPAEYFGELMDLSDELEVK